MPHQIMHPAYIMNAEGTLEVPALAACWAKASGTSSWRQQSWHDMLPYLTVHLLTEGL